MNTRALLLLALGAFTPGLAAPAGKIAALARVQPAGGIVTLEGPAGDAVAEVRVREGESVAAGAVLVVLQSEPAARAELAQAEVALREAREQQPVALALQELAVKQARAEAEFTARIVTRYEEGEVSKVAEQVYETRAHQASLARLRLEAAERELAALRLRQATALARAEAQLAAARARLARSLITASSAGTVLEVAARTGEATGRRPLVQFADLSQMVAIADVYEGELARVAPGQAATITSKSLPKPLRGKVASVGRVISGQGKVGKVRIVLDEPAAVAGLIDAEVDVTLEL
jgi:HlyD family secretion protein